MGDKKKCTHQETFVAVRHESGLQLVKCKKCGATL